MKLSKFFKYSLFCLAVMVITACAGGLQSWQHDAPPAEKAPKSLISEASASEMLRADPVLSEDLALRGPQGPGDGFDDRDMRRAPDRPDMFGQQLPGPPVVKVALLVPLSGPHGELGEAMLQASQMALFDLGFDNYELLPRDTKGTPDGAREAARDAVAAGAQLVLGPLFSGSVKAAKNITRRRGLNMLAFSTDWTLAGSHTYVMGFLPFSQVERIARYASGQGIEDIAILAPNSDYGNIVIAAYNSYAYRSGIETAKVRRFPPDATDISDIVRDFTNYDEREAAKEALEKGEANVPQSAGMDETGGIPPLPFEAVLLPVGGEKARTIASLLSYYGLEPDQVRRLGTGLWDEPRLASEPALAGSWFAAPSPDLRRDFEERYTRLYRVQPPRIATLAYDATALSAVLARTGLQRRGAPAFGREYLTNPNGFAGLDGIFRFRTNGLIERGLAVLEFSNGDIVIRDEAPATFQRPGSQ